MNRPIRRVAIALAALLVALFVNLNYVQVVKGSAYRDDPDNRRVLLNEYATPRGDINVGGTAVAHSKATRDELKYLRVYPDGKTYAPVTGYYSYIYGTTGIEAAENGILSGNDSRLFGTRLADLLTGRNPRGGSVELTIDKAAQRAAYDALVASGNGAPRQGAVVALDPTTGAILAAVSTPSYNPSRLSQHNANAVQRYWKSLHPNSPTSPLLNRAFSERYPPGSTFKVVVSAAALKAGIKPKQELIAPNGYYPSTGQTVSSCHNDVRNCIENFQGEQCDNGKTATLAFSLAKSCNTTFAALAVEQLRGNRIRNEAKLFGFDPKTPLTVPLTIARSTVGTKKDLTDNGLLAHTAFGQQDVAMTPLQGAMLSAAVANDGILMKPYLVGKELAPDLKLLQRTAPSQLSQVLDPNLDQKLQTMMEGVITSPEGTGAPADITDIPDVVVGGKTGTSDVGATSASGKAPDAWFTGYAMRNGVPKIAVAVIIVHGGVNGNETTGGQAAGPVAKQVMEAYLRAHG
jgi:peptidoglycan glycosyltransferase